MLQFMLGKHSLLWHICAWRVKRRPTKPCKIGDLENERDTVFGRSSLKVMKCLMAVSISVRFLYWCNCYDIFSTGNCVVDLQILGTTIGLNNIRQQGISERVARSIKTKNEALRSSATARYQRWRSLDEEWMYVSLTSTVWNTYKPFTRQQWKNRSDPWEQFGNNVPLMR